MEQRLNIVTLGVSDLERARQFYCVGLGWRSSSASQGDILFLSMGGILLALYPRHLLAEDARVPAPGAVAGFGGVTLAQNVATKAEVDGALEAARLAGATILKPAQEVFWGGYSGYFADPDGHPWEVAYNPHWALTADGRLALPE